MFAPVVLPVLITCMVLLVLAIGLSLCLHRVTNHPILISILVCAILGIPILLLVGEIVDSIRYGEFHHVDASELNDGYILLPPDATNITVHKYASGHELKFKTTKKSLESWMDKVTKERREYANATPFELEERSELDPQVFEHLFGKHGWHYSDDTVVYGGWVSDRGGGFDVWYSEKRKTAFIQGRYW